MQKGFGSAPKKKFLKDSRYLKFYNDEKYAENLLKTRGSLIMKLFQGSGSDSFIKELKKMYNRVSIIKPKANQEPCFLFIRLLFLPIQPRPASSAHAFSRSGELSTHILYLQSGISSLIHILIFFNFF